MWPEWVAYNIYFSKPVFFVKGLILAHGLVDNAIIHQLILIVTSNLLRKSVPAAAVLVNLEQLIVAFFRLLATILSEGYYSRFATIVYATAAYIFGLLLLWLVVIRQNFTATLILLLFLLTAMGQAGKYPLELFFKDQLTAEREPRCNDAKKKVAARARDQRTVLQIVGSIVSAFLIYTKDTKVTLLASKLVMGAALLLLLCGRCCGPYTPRKTTAHPFRAARTFSKVLIAACVKRGLDYPDSPTGYYKNKKKELRFPPDFPYARWIDKAAIDKQCRCWRCSVAEVKKVKRFITWFPLTQTLFVYSLVQGTGNSIFLTQSDGLNFLFINGFRVNIGAFLLIRSLTSAATSHLIDLLVKKKTSCVVWRQRATLVRINAGMVVSALFCLIAWRVEIRRSKLFCKQGEIVGPSSCYRSPYKLPMSIFWLTPQFILLGLMDALVDDGHTKFFKKFVHHQALRRFGTPLSMLAVRIQRYFSIIWAVKLFRRSLSPDHINIGGLAKYFKILAIVSFGSLFPHFLVSYLYSSEAVLQRQTVHDPPTDGDHNCPSQLPCIPCPRDVDHICPSQLPCIPCPRDVDHICPSQLPCIPSAIL